MFTPWSAINLVDYYCFTRSRYDVPALTDPDGRYGRWNAIGIVSNLIGILVQVPFLSTALIYAGSWAWSCRPFCITPWPEPPDAASRTG